METARVISEIKGLVREAETDLQNGNVDGANTRVINIMDYIKTNYHLNESTPPPTPETPPPSEEPSETPEGTA